MIRRAMRARAQRRAARARSPWAVTQWSLRAASVARRCSRRAWAARCGVLGPSGARAPGAGARGKPEGCDKVEPEG
eukprot:6589851-Lingulodinium_polyedra.AAC.1